MKILKTILLLITITLSTNTFAQFEACGNCNTSYLKAKTFGGSIRIYTNKTNYVFYKLYTTVSNRCYSQNKASDKVSELFSEALKKNREYQRVIEAYKEENNQYPMHRDGIVGRIVHHTTVHREVLKQFLDMDERNNNVEFIEIDAYLAGYFQNKILCN